MFNASQSSGPTYRVCARSGFTDGNGSTLDLTKAGANVTIRLNVPVAGNYDVKYAMERHNTRDAVQLTIGDANVGINKDEYSANEIWQEFDLGTASLQAGNITIVFITVSKDSASSGFTQAFDYIKLTPQ